MGFGSGELVLCLQGSIWIGLPEDYNREDKSGHSHNDFFGNTASKLDSIADV